MLQTVFDLVPHFLGDEHPHAAFIDRADQLAESFQLVVLATEGDHQHAAGIGMMDHVAEYAARILVVVTQLGTSVIVRERDNRIDGRFPVGAGNDGTRAVPTYVIAGLTGNLLLEPLHDRLANPVYTPDRGNDPDLVAHAHLPVGPPEPLECHRLLFRRIQIVRSRTKLFAAFFRRKKF